MPDIQQNNQNRPQQNTQQSQPQAKSTGTTSQGTFPVAQDTTKAPKPIDASNYTFAEVLALLIEKIVSKNVTPSQGVKLLHVWYHSMSEAERATFLANRIDADNTVQYFKGVVDTLAQELPYLLTMQG